MSRNRVIGQNRVKKILGSSMKRNLLAHAYLFHGLSGVGKDAMAVSMAMGLNCKNRDDSGCGQCPACQKILYLESPHFHFVLPTPSRPKSMKEETYQEVLRERALNRIKHPFQEISYSPEISTLPVIGIDQIREMKRQVMLKLAEGGYRIFLISQADRMTLQASNSLLKLLEEPPQKTILFLTTSNPGRLLQTIVSRCQSIRFDPLSEEETEEALIEWKGLPREKARLLARMAGGSLQRAEALAEGVFEEKREAARNFLEDVTDEDDLKGITACESLLNSRDKVEMKSIFQLLQVWIRDLYQIQLGFPGQILNVDSKEQLMSFIQKRPAFNAEEGLRTVEQAIDFIEKNVYLHLIVFGLFQRLRTCRNPSFSEK